MDVWPGGRVQFAWGRKTGRNSGERAKHSAKKYGRAMGRDDDQASRGNAVKVRYWVRWQVGQKVKQSKYGKKKSGGRKKKRRHGPTSLKNS